MEEAAVKVEGLKKSCRRTVVIVLGVRVRKELGTGFLVGRHECHWQSGMGEPGTQKYPLNLFFLGGGDKISE